MPCGIVLICNYCIYMDSALFIEVIIHIIDPDDVGMFSFVDLKDDSWSCSELTSQAILPLLELNTPRVYIGSRLFSNK